MNIGIMGGTFNPIHNAHLLIAEMAREQYSLQRVIFMTGGIPPHKTAITGAEDRFNMTRLAIEGNAYFTDDDYEIKKDGKSYTVETLLYLKEKYPKDKLFFIIGEDSLDDIGKWYEPRRILEMATVLVFPRKTAGTLKEKIGMARRVFDGEILPIDAPVIDISSTDIRGRIGDTKTVKYMLPDKVIEYIKEHNLYADGD
ncbi:MAG: nicotinate-nucleotide adenylyltransferase [Clostridia bacterium]|nr:nicotinate-nucleotide adenylyltransferase [Clostridia bacterium]